jgi:hypothetical protein
MLQVRHVIACTVSHLRTVLTPLSTAYFEECHYAIFGVAHRPASETRLRAQFAHPSEFQDDPSWFALRNALYASGCRVVLSKDPMKTFNEAQTESWKYFENSLSVHTELICTPTGLTVVQALVLMVRTFLTLYHVLNIGTLLELLL